MRTLVRLEDEGGGEGEGLVNAGGYAGSLEIGERIGVEGFVGDGSNQMKNNICKVK